MYRWVSPPPVDGYSKKSRFGWLFNRVARPHGTSFLEWLRRLFLVPALTCTDLTHAALTLTPSVQMAGSYEDNISLSATTSESTSALRLSTAVGLTHSDPSGEIRGVLGLDFVDYSGEDANPQDGNQFVQIDSFQRARRSVWRLHSTLKHDTLVRTVELPEQDEPDSGDSDVNVALVSVPVERLRLLLSPSWNYNLTRRDVFRLGYDLATEHYDDAAGVNVVDYYRHGLAARLTHHFSVKSSLGTDVRARRFAPEDGDAVDTYEVRAAFSHRYSPVDTLGLNLGARRVLRAETDSTGFVAGISWRGKTELAVTSFKLERQLYPNGLGDLEETDQIVAQWTQRLSRATQLLAKGRAFNSTPVSSDSETGREYAQVDVELQHAIDRWWNAGIAYRHRWIERKSDPDSAENNGLFISIGYAEPLMLE